MALAIDSIRKVVNITWGTDVTGQDVTIEAEGQAKKVVKNTPAGGDLFFPTDFTGTVNVTVRGSTDGEETAALEVT
jgi:hypothetical protein